VTSPRIVRFRSNLIGLHSLITWQPICYKRSRSESHRASTAWHDESAVKTLQVETDRLTDIKPGENHPSVERKLW